MSRPLPQNIEAEKGLLGIILAENDQLFNVSHLITKADFIEPFHGELFTLLKDMAETGREAKPATVMHDLAQDADIGGISAVQYLVQLEREAPHWSMAETFARTIRDLATRRRLIIVAQEHVEEAYSAPATITALEIENRFHARASSLFSRVQDAGMVPLPDIGYSVLERTSTALQKADSRGLLTGLKALDDLWGPLFPGRLHGIAGASGSGKTALAWQIARSIADAEDVLFFSLEMDGEELATRDLTFLTGIPAANIESAQLNEDEFTRLVEAQEKQKASKLVVDSAKGQTVGALRGKALRMKRMRGLSLLVIDHWRYIRPSSRGEHIETMLDDLRALNALADDLGVPVILLAQLKASYGQDIKDITKGVREPNVGDIYNGAALEQECDALVLVHRPEYMIARRKPADQDGRVQWQGLMQKEAGRAHLLLNKRRGGAGYGSRTVGFDAPTTRFTDEIPALDPMMLF